MRHSVADCWLSVHPDLRRTVIQRHLKVLGEFRAAIDTNHEQTPPIEDQCGRVPTTFTMAGLKHFSMF